MAALHLALPTQFPRIRMGIRMSEVAKILSAIFKARREKILGNYLTIGELLLDNPKKLV